MQIVSLPVFLQLRYYNALNISQYIYHGEFMIIMRSARNELMIIFRGYRIIIVIINFIFSPPHYDALSRVAIDDERALI